jgi:hypothetical protein
MNTYQQCKLNDVLHRYKINKTTLEDGVKEILEAFNLPVDSLYKQQYVDQFNDLTQELIEYKFSSTGRNIDVTIEKIGDWLDHNGKTFSPRFDYNYDEKDDNDWT